MLKFYAHNDDAIKCNSLVPASKVTMKWLENAWEVVEQLPKNIPLITRCPGIASVTSTGWILKSHTNFTIETNGDGESFNASVEEGPNIGRHVSEQMAIYRSSQPLTLRTIVKVYSPWVVDIPDGYSLLLMPIPYPDDYRFTAATGLLRGKQPINIQLFWHCLNSKEVVSKGTPLNQMILIKDEKLNYTISRIEEGNNISQEIEDNLRKRGTVVINKPQIKPNFDIQV